MMESGDIPMEVSDRLWGIFGSASLDISIKQRRGAILILGMLAKAFPELISDRIDILQSMGIEEYGRVMHSINKRRTLCWQNIHSVHCRESFILTIRIQGWK